MNADAWSALGSVVGAVGTVGTLAWVAGYEISNRKAVRAEKHDAQLEKRREQATMVSAWLPQRWGGPHSSGVVIDVLNGSRQPVHEFVAYLVWVQGSGFRTGQEAEEYAGHATNGLPAGALRAVTVSLNPGGWRLLLGGPSNAPMQGVLGVEIAFTDAAGVHWVRRGDGQLDEIANPPMTHYEISRPLEFVYPIRTSE